MSKSLVVQQALIAPDVVRKIALDIGKSVALHIETMYPNAVTATTPNMLISVRNTVYNEIMAALQTTDETEILQRLEERKKWRRNHRKTWKNIREGT
jgi:hypothetical protein